MVLPAIAALVMVASFGAVRAGEADVARSGRADIAALRQCLLDAIAAWGDLGADRLLDDLGKGIPLLHGDDTGAVRRTAPAGLDPHTMLAEFQSLARMPQPGFGPGQEGGAAALAEAQAEVAAAASRAFPTVTDEETRRRLVELALVLPLLGTADDQWDSAATAALQRAALQPPDLPSAEGFALHCGRPLTAWWLASASRALAGGIPEQLAYIGSAGARMAEARDPQAAVCCLRVGIRLARGAGERSALRDLSVRLAGVLADIGQPTEAARCIEELVATDPQVADRPALVAQRLNLLCRGGAYAEALEAAARERGQAGPDHASAEVLYALWVCHRRLGHDAEAGAAMTEFLDRFPRHSLAAEVLFGEAQAALSALDYRAADRYLAQIQTVFAGSDSAARATELRGNLEKAFGGAPRQP